MSNRLSGDCSIPKFFVPYLTPADITTVLQRKNKALYNQVAQVLLTNKQERHIRGGIATRDKYKALKNTKKTP
ncbi:MAG: sporulation transcriptional regulator SpoIIID [Oscillospiraceae bacterium]|nr:sporulation transcriptional regulator SpoIIID [Oscillospiraceae bacterium]